MHSMRLVYINMYFTLDLAFESDRNDVLRQFLSESNPFLFKDGASADPAVWAEFSSAFRKYFDSDMADDEQSYNFVEEFLASNDMLLKQIFQKTVSVIAWSSNFTKLGEYE